MGFILSKIWGRETTSQKIEKIQNEIVSIQNFKRDTQARQAKISKRLNISFCVMYALAIVLGLIYAKFYYHNPQKNMDFLFKFKIFLGFSLAPLTFWILKKILSWWFTRHLNKNEVKLKKLREKKSEILDQVTETETFKVAREILEKFAPELLSKYGMVSGYRMSSSSSSVPSASSSFRSSYSSDNSSSIRRRVVPTTSISGITSSISTSSISSSGTPTSITTTSTSTYSTSSNQPSVTVSGGRVPAYQPRPLSSYGPPRHRGPGPRNVRPFTRPMPPTNRHPIGPPLPRPVVPVQKSVFGKLMDYVVGEGPGNQYALICNQCQSHNGMAQKEDYDFTSYRCCFCHYWNPPKKKRPIAPKLELLEKAAVSDEKDKEKESTEENDKKVESLEEKDKRTEALEEKDEKPEEIVEDANKDNSTSKEEDKVENNASISEETAVSKTSISSENSPIPKTESTTSDHALTSEPNYPNESEVSFEEGNGNEQGENMNSKSFGVASEEDKSDNGGTNPEVEDRNANNPDDEKSDCESDIDIIGEEEAFEAKEVEEKSKSNIEANQKKSELNSEE